MYNRAGTGGKPGDTPAATSLTCSLVLCHRAPGLAHSPQLGSSCMPPGKAAQPGVPWELHPSVQQGPWTLRQLQMHDLKTRVLFTEVNELHSQHKPLWEFWYYLNLMHFPVPTFPELDCVHWLSSLGSPSTACGAGHTLQIPSNAGRDFTLASHFSNFFSQSWKRIYFYNTDSDSSAQSCHKK